MQIYPCESSRDAPGRDPHPNLVMKATSRMTIKNTQQMKMKVTSQMTMKVTSNIQVNEITARMTMNVATHMQRQENYCTYESDRHAPRRDPHPDLPRQISTGGVRER
jgi:hypothetical protein